MSVRKAYSAWSATYDLDRNLTRDLDQIVTRQTLENIRCNSILEIGSGTGKNTALLARIGERVLAIDFSQEMVEKAKAKIQADNVTFSVADVTREWPCADASADLIVCNLVLEHIADLSFIFSEAGRCLVNGGRFFISELHPFRQYQGIKANFQRDGETTEIQAFVHHISDFTGAAERNGLALDTFHEWWHQEDQGKPPRLVSFIFKK
jgi:malonyl-CoA O-methyltransferase